MHDQAGALPADMVGAAMEQQKIYGALASIMAEVQPIAKGRRNTQQGFMYRGIDEIMNELQPILAKHRVVVVPEVLEHVREDRTSNKGNALIYSVCKMKYTFYADDGSSVAAVVVGEGMDSGDKATNKAMAVAMKYAMLQTLCIPTEDAKDPDAEAHSVQPRNKPTPVTTQNPAPAAAERSRQDAIARSENLAVTKGYTAELVDAYLTKVGTSRDLATHVDCEKMLAVFRTMKPKAHQEMLTDGTV